MKKSHITIKDEKEAPYDILGKQIEVFYLSKPDNPDPKFDPNLPTLADLCLPTQPSISLEDAVKQISSELAAEGITLDDDFLEPPLIVDDAGVNIETGKYVGGSIEEASDDYGDPLMGNELDVNENSAGGGVHYTEHFGSVHPSCCPTGNEGVKGPRGIDEERMYPLILESLKKFSECLLDLDKDSHREVLADGIAKKITKYMWPSEEE